jgi:hypothetical protein
MLADPRYGTWLAEPFLEADLDAAAAWLHRQRLIDGMTVDESQGPVRLYLTDAGVACAEEFCSDTARFVAARRTNETGPSIDRSAGAQVGAGNVQVNHFYGNSTWTAGDRSPENESSPRPSREAAPASAISVEPRSRSFPAQLTQRTVLLNNGLHSGTMVAIEVRAHHELKQAATVMVGVTGPAGAATIPPRARLYWHPSARYRPRSPRVLQTS